MRYWVLSRPISQQLKTVQIRTRLINVDTVKYLAVLHLLSEYGRECGVCMCVWGVMKIFLCTSSTQIYRLLMEAFRGVGDNSSHSFTRQFPIATTCFVLFHGDILVLFISLHFYWTHKGVLQCIIIRWIPLLYSIKRITLNDGDRLSFSQTDPYLWSSG